MSEIDLALGPMAIGDALRARGGREPQAQERRERALRMIKPEIKTLSEVAGGLALLTSPALFRDVVPGQIVDVDVTLTNTGDHAVAWNDNEFLNLSYRWFTADANDVLVQDGPRTSVGGFFHPRESRTYAIRVAVPDFSGDATLRVSCVYEGHFWFFDALSTGWMDVAVSISAPLAWPQHLTQSPAARALRGAVTALTLRNLLDAGRAAEASQAIDVPSWVEPPLASPEPVDQGADAAPFEVTGSRHSDLSALRSFFDVVASEAAIVATSSEASDEITAPQAASHTRWRLFVRRTKALFQPRRAFERVHHASLEGSRLGREVSEIRRDVRTLLDLQANASRVADRDRELLFSSVEALSEVQRQHAETSRSLTEALSRKLDLLGQDAARIFNLSEQIIQQAGVRGEQLQADFHHIRDETAALSRAAALLYQGDRENTAALEQVSQTQRRALRLSRMTARIIAGLVREAEAHRAVPSDMSNLARNLTDLAASNIETDARIISVTGLLEGMARQLIDLGESADRLERSDPVADVKVGIVGIEREQSTLKGLVEGLEDKVREVPGRLLDLHEKIEGLRMVATAAALEEAVGSIRAQVDAARGDRAAFETEVVSRLRQAIPMLKGLDTALESTIGSLREEAARADLASRASQEGLAKLLSHTGDLSDAAGDLRLLVAERLNALLVREVFPIPALGVVICRNMLGFVAIPDGDLEALSYYSGGLIPEPGTIQVIEALLSEGDCFVDIGANVGLFSVVAGRRVGPGGRVIAFEPTPSTIPAFTATTRLNGVADVVVLHPVAASDRNGPAILNIGRTSGHNSLIPLVGSSETAAVEMVRTDDLLAGLKVHLIKIDVEGWELSVLDGLTETLAANPQIRIVLEFGPSHLQRGGITVDGWRDRIARTGLKAFEIDENTAVIRPLRVHGLESVFTMNVLLAREAPETLTLDPAR